MPSEPQGTGTPQKALAAEDNPVIRTALKAMLAWWGYDPVIAADGLEASRLLAAPDGPRLAVLDWMMPGMDGLEVCRRVRAGGGEPYRYILLLTGRTAPEDVVAGMDAGADDYLTKPFNAHELRARLRAGARIVRLQEELLAAREALREQATHDGLTGLWNRCSILSVLDEELARASREGRPLAVMIADIDCFKRINDSHGHLAGDAVLREVAGRMREAVRCYDAVGRYGGEEFLFVMPGCAGDSAMQQADRIRLAVGCAPVEALGGCLRVTCSVGVAHRQHPYMSEAAALLQEADTSLYTAKSQGRDRVGLAAGLASRAG